MSTLSKTLSIRFYNSVQAAQSWALESLWPLLTVSFVLIFIGIGLRDPWPADEPRFALIAKEMVETGQWFFPARAQELYPDKPPIFMWAIALFYYLSGSIRFSFLMPSALAGLLTIFLVYDIGRLLWDKKVGLVAGWLLLFCLQFLVQAKSAQIDALVCAWITLGCYGLLRYTLVDGKYRWYACAWFFMGIGVITKGVGFLPLLMLIPYVVYRLLNKAAVSPVRYAGWTWYLGPLIMLGAIALWFVPMLIIVAQSDSAAYELYRDNILLKQTVTRYADSWHHIKPFWYYLTSVAPFFWLPAVLCIPWLFKPWMKDIKLLEARILLPLAWVALVLLFFSMSPGKRGVYIFPALPMLALAIAPYYSLLAKKKPLKNLIFGIVLVLSIIILSAGILASNGLEALSKQAVKLEISPWGFFMSVGLVSLLALLVFAWRHRWLAWPVFSIVIWSLYSTYGYSLRNNVSTPIAVFERATPYLKANSEIALVKFSEQFILFSPYAMHHFGYHTLLEQQLAGAYAWLHGDNRHLIIEDEKLDSACFDEAKAVDLGFAHRRHWLLVSASAKRESCELSALNVKMYYYKRRD